MSAPNISTAFPNPMPIIDVLNVQFPFPPIIGINTGKKVLSSDIIIFLNVDNTLHFPVSPVGDLYSIHALPNPRLQ